VLDVRLAGQAKHLSPFLILGFRAGALRHPAGEFPLQHTQYQVAYFCEHYSSVSSIEPYMIEDALRDPDWVVEMQEELNNFTRNEV
jgi:hypothetical protein